ncbi:MAG: bacillithiol biosynthesis deacetylase BshB1 [Flavobacteriales bacterium]|nr:bacillithiol biosynthesis deacetylase BshB1 [Flavobacteriales bacterium]|tara:strand:- start:2523 stop:3242 length:720 start_codon:yes stop_codon:yes gene_type:complete
MSNIDILAFGAHPDDVELGCGGTILRHISLGFKVGLIDLTRGELGTRGSANIRDKEAKVAAEKMGVSFRENLLLSDGFFENNKQNQLEVIKRIRHYRPRIILCNSPNDRHPDHGRASQLVSEACFLSGLIKIVTEFKNHKQDPFRPYVLYNYIQYDDIKPDFLVDISPFMKKKMEIIKSYSSQFYNPESQELETLISTKSFLELVSSRSKDLGRFISTEYAEGFLNNRYLGVNNLFDLL